LKRLVINGDELCRTPVELLFSDLFKQVLARFLFRLSERNSTHLDFLISRGLVKGKGPEASYELEALIELLVALLRYTPEEISIKSPQLEFIAEERIQMYYLIEELYDYWRKMERFLVFKEDYRLSNIMTKDYHDWFRKSTQDFESLVRETYRRITNRLSGQLFKVYRQLPSGVGAGLLLEYIPWQAAGAPYKKLEKVPFIQLAILEPPLIYYPNRNYRSGSFTPIETNPLEEVDIYENEWFCFPAKVGFLKTYIYFHQDFLPLGISLVNLFEIASGEEVLAGNPDCILIFGAGGLTGQRKTAYYEDRATNTAVGIVSGGEDIDYFGYLKKMALTLHNVTMINRGWFPIHGAMAKVILRTGKSANIIIVGDTGAGKSESLEAFRSLAEDYISDLEIIFDDMGVIGKGEVDEVIAYGTETGAFVRLDDLEPGYAYSEVDRSIFMNPQLINARVVIPITYYDRIMKGYPVDFFLYANNHEQVDEEHPVIEFYLDAEAATKVFESGARLSKGTTDEHGLVHTYFANPFGAVQKRNEHHKIAREYFELMLASGTKVGQLRTRLGIKGYETTGPQASAKALLEMLKA
jgi:hypothetical protein